LLELFEYYARHKSSLSQPGQTIFEVGILNFAHAIVRASNLAIPKLVRELLEQCLSRSGPKRVVESATSVYRRIQPRPSSFAGIAAWYRKHPELPLIHNWQADTFHYLENDVAEDLFDLAANNLSDEDLITRVAAEYETEKTQVAEDARTFFATINPTRPVGGEFRLDRVPLGGR